MRAGVGAGVQMWVQVLGGVEHRSEHAAGLGVGG